MMGYTSDRQCIHIEINRRFNLIHKRELTGETASNIAKRYFTSRKTYYKWNNRYKQKGIEGLLDVSKRAHNIKYKKVTPEIEDTIFDLRLTKRFGCNRIRFNIIINIIILLDGYIINAGVSIFRCLVLQMGEL
jgi:hypothetical protein